MLDSVKIIGNYKSGNHFKEISKLSKKSDELILVSPFLTNDIGVFLEKMSSIKNLTVYTVFEGYNDALNKAYYVEKYGLSHKTQVLRIIKGCN